MSPVGTGWISLFLKRYLSPRVLTLFDCKIRIRNTDSTCEDSSAKWDDKPLVFCTVYSLTNRNILKIRVFIKYTKHLIITTKQINCHHGCLRFPKTEDEEEKDIFTMLMINSHIPWVIIHLKKKCGF